MSDTTQNTEGTTPRPNARKVREGIVASAAGE
jgi:hypothetical protein